MDNSLANAEYTAITKRLDNDAAVKGPTIEFTSYSNITTIESKQFGDYIAWLHTLEKFRIQAHEDMRRLLEAYKWADSRITTLNEKLNSSKSS